MLGSAKAKSFSVMGAGCSLSFETCTSPQFDTDEYARETLALYALTASDSLRVP